MRWRLSQIIPNADIDIDGDVDIWFSFFLFIIIPPFVFGIFFSLVGGKEGMAHQIR